MLVVRPFDKAALDLHPFSCGVPDLDTWLVRYAGQNERRDNTRTFLLLDPVQGRIAGYYAQRTYELAAQDAEAALGRSVRFPVPAVLIARFAVDREYQGRGLGRLLLFHSLRTLHEASQSVGFQLVVVHAISREAALFYESCGFQRFATKPLQLFMTTKDLRATFADAELS